MSGCHNPVLQDWHDQRLAEIQSLERVARQHIEAMAMRADAKEEPLRSELHAARITIENVMDYARSLINPQT